MRTREQLEELIKIIQDTCKKEFGVTITIDVIRERAIHRSQKLIEQFIDNRIGHLNLQDAHAFSTITSLTVEEQEEQSVVSVSKEAIELSKKTVEEVIEHVERRQEPKRRGRPVKFPPEGAL